MPIAAPGKSLLQSSIRSALKKSMDDGAKDGADPEKIISNLATDLTNAIDSYVTSCIVTINPGQTVISSVAGPVATGNTISPGTS
jgi:hypothetical protein